MKNYIGLATSPHDPAIAIIDKNGELVFAEGAERRLQSKRAWGNPPDHANYIEDLVATYCDPNVDTVVAVTWPKSMAFGTALVLRLVKYQFKRAAQKDRKFFASLKLGLVTHRSMQQCATTGLEYALAGGTSQLEKRYFSHHLTHAAAAAYGSPYDKGLCVVIDGLGENGSIGAYDYRDGTLTKIKSVKAFPASLGVFYSLMCDICGFDSMKGEEWKLMGLAAYGKVDRTLYDLLRPMIRVDGVTLKNGLNNKKRTADLNDMRRKPGTPAKAYADFAATAQSVFTETLHQLLRNIHALKPSDTLILSGGCGLNSSTNGTILDNTPFKELYVNSAPADDGNAVGAAYLSYFQDNPYRPRKGGVLSPYLGGRIRTSSLSRLQRYCGFRMEELDDDALCAAVAAALADGKIVGWAQGRAEFGPRALGNRSILADPRSTGVKERINAEVKFREEFRPFAPSILHEHGPNYFQHYQCSPYMERTLRFTDWAKTRVPGVVHVDGTGRLQSVTEQLNPRYYRLIKAFYQLTGIPVLLNTSFNVMGKPIVDSVEDAVGVFQTSGLDLLVVENSVFIKDPDYELATNIAAEQLAAPVEA
jgi:carbamoyltransferase